MHNVALKKIIVLNENGHEFIFISSQTVRNPHPLHVSFFLGASNRFSLHLWSSVVHTKPVHSMQLTIVDGGTTVSSSFDPWNSIHHTSLNTQLKIDIQSACFVSWWFLKCSGPSLLNHIVHIDSSSPCSRFIMWQFFPRLF